MTQTTPILVLGGTGKTGRRVVARLQARGQAVRIGSRSAEPPFDWENPATWGPALEGVDAVYITYQPDLAVPGALDVVRAFTAQAVTSGVRRLVLLSGRGEAEAEEAERVVQASGVEWTILRAAWFNQNFSEDFMLDSVLAGEVALPNDTVLEPFIDVEDIADVAVAALTQPGHAGQLYELTGPRLLTFPQAVAEISAASGRDIRFVPLTPEQFTAGLREVGLSQGIVTLMHYLFTDLMDGRNAGLGDGVQRALGRAPRDFRDFARQAAASGVWRVPAAEEAS